MVAPHVAVEILSAVERRCYTTFAPWLNRRPEVEILSAVERRCY